jgi:hypothetical protein
MAKAISQTLQEVNNAKGGAAQIQSSLEVDAVLCIYCDSLLQVEANCHLIQMKKPTSTMYGLCREGLMFLKLPKAKDIRIKNDNGKLCKLESPGVL